MFLSYFRRVFYVSFFLLVLVVSGCSWFKDSGPKPSVSGLRPEMFLPKDTAAVFSLDYRNEQTRARLTSMMAKFPDENGKSVLDNLRDIFLESFSAQGYDFERDVKPMLGQGTRFVFAIEGGQALSDYVASSGSKSLPIYLGFELSDVNTFDQFASGLVERKEVTPMPFESYTLYDAQDEIQDAENGCMARVSDVALIANTCDLLKAAISRNDSGDNLEESKHFQTILGELPTEYFGFYYVSAMDFYSVMKDQLLSRPGFSNLAQSFTSFDASLAKGGVILLEDDGLLMQGYEFADKEKMAGKTYKDFYPSSSLANKLSAQDLVFYFEGVNLRQALENYFARLDASGAQTLDEFYQKVGKASGETRASVKDAFRVIGLDLDEDVMSWMDHGFAVAFNLNGNSAFPGVTFMVDGASKSDALSRTVSVLDAQIQGLMTMLRVQGGDQLADAVKREVNGSLYTLSIDAAALSGSEFERLQGIFTSQPLHVTYGATTESYFVLSSLLDFVKNYGISSVADSEQFKTAKNRLGDVDAVAFYVNPQNLLKYVELLEPVLDQQNKVPAVVLPQADGAVSPEQPEGQADEAVKPAAEIDPAASNVQTEATVPGAELPSDQDYKKSLERFKNLLRPIQVGIFGVKLGKTEAWMRGYVGIGD